MTRPRLSDPPARLVDPLLTISDLAELLATTERQVRRLVFERRVPYLKVGRFVRFERTEIATWLEGRHHPAANEPYRRSG